MAWHDLDHGLAVVPILVVLFDLIGGVLLEVALLYLLTDYDLDHQVHHSLVKQDRRGATFYTLDHWHISLHFVTNPNIEW